MIHVQRKLFRGRFGTPQHVISSAANQSPAFERRSGFTLIELLVSIGIIGVLLAIAVPALRGVRDSGREVVCLANLRSLGMTVEEYTQSHGREFPFAPPGTWIPTSPPSEGAISKVRGAHWDLSHSWPGLMGDVALWREHFPSWICPGAPRNPQKPWNASEQFGGSSLSSYAYSNSFIARPQVWTPDATPDDRLLSPARTQDVAFASAKVIFYDLEMAHTVVKPGTDPQRPMLFVDGHAALKRRGDAAAPVVNPFTGGASPLHDTPFGAKGHDY